MCPKSREDLIAFCLSFMSVYEDYPFDANWTAMRHKGNDKTFAFIFEHEGQCWCNVKVTPVAAQFWRESFPSIQPAYHMNKTHWIGLPLDESVPNDVFERILTDSYLLTAPKKKTAAKGRNSGTEGVKR